jgi:large subunit ribosomal protein L25
LAFGSIIFTPEVYIVNLNIDGKEVRAILQEVQYHPVTDKPLHADFLQVFDDKVLSVAIPTKLVGDSIGVMKGGKLIHKMHRVVVKGLINDIPDAIEVDITKLDIGKSIKIRDLSIDKLVLTDPANSVIVRTKTARNLEEELVDDEDEEGEEAAEAPAEEAPAAE